MQTKTPKLRSGSRRCPIPFKPVVPLWGVFMAMVTVGFGTVQIQAANAGLSFAKDILPILAENCFQCHGPDEQQRKAGLRLDRFEFATQSLTSGGQAIAPGDPSGSGMIQRMASTDEEDRMPPPKSGKALTSDEIDTLRHWVENGASYEVHWAFRPLQAPVIPDVSADHGVRNPIDAFVQARLHEEGVDPSPEADRYTLIKRLYYDLQGLLPTPEEVDAFVADSAPDAYRRLMNRLLDSDHFGERWGRHWLDKSRYADSDGYEKDNPRPNAWKYRDWVIRVINQDLPFDQFTVEQLAGDLLPNASDDQKLATAFHRQTLTNTEGGTNREQWRVAAVMDRTETTGSVWLGLTVGCARCHTHKYDPITHQEYYQFYAFFNNGEETGFKMPQSEKALAAYRRAKPAFDQEKRDLEERLHDREAELDARFEAWVEALRVRLEEGEKDGVPEPVQAIVQAGTEIEGEKNRKVVNAYYYQQDADWTSLKKVVDEQTIREPKSPYLDLRVISQRKKNPRITHILERGDFAKPLGAVSPGGLAVLPSIEGRNGSADRLDFARWLVSAENPLTPRVVVNQIWSNLFGIGLVPTRNDFGIRGETPSHPELLDHLAKEFVARNWSRKAIIRYIVMSRTYRQASDHRPELTGKDSLNRLLARQNRFRVEAEIVRDLHLNAGDLLARKIGGPSVFPPTSQDVVALTYNSSVQWKVSPGEDQYRRGMYTFFKRTAPHPNLMTFDCPDSNTTCIERNRSNTPLAALTTLNNEVFVDAARGFARRMLGLDFEADRDRMRRSFRTACVREPLASELDALERLLSEARGYYRAHPKMAGDLMGIRETEEAVEGAAWMTCLRVILNLDEVITRG